MKNILLLLILNALLFSPDSLYWFDMSKVRDPIPPTPKVLDKVFGTSQLNVLDSIKNANLDWIITYRSKMIENKLKSMKNRSKKYHKIS